MDNHLTGAGGDDEFQGNVDYTFTRPDGTQLGNQAQSAWLQDCEQSFFFSVCSENLTVLSPRP